MLHLRFLLSLLGLLYLLLLMPLLGLFCLLSLLGLFRLQLRLVSVGDDVIGTEGGEVGQSVRVVGTEGSQVWQSVHLRYCRFDHRLIKRENIEEEYQG